MGYLIYFYLEFYVPPFPSREIFERLAFLKYFTNYRRFLLEDGDQYSWLENYAGSSGLRTGSVLLDSNVPIHQLELDRWEPALTYCPLLKDAANYIPDTVDLNSDQEAR